MINVITSVLIAFGGFAQGGSGTNLILNNSITLTTDYDCGFYANTIGSVERYRVQAHIDCDFREKNNEQGIPEYFIANITKLDFNVYAYSPDGSLVTEPTFSTNPDNKVVDFDVFNLSDPLNSFYFFVDNSLSSIKFNTSVTLELSTVGGDSVAYNTASFEIPYLISTDNVTGTAQDIRSDIDLFSLEQQVRYAFNNNSGGYGTGYQNGYNVGVEDGKSDGYSVGYSDGYTDGVETNGTAFTIFNGILGIGMLPINVFLAMLNWEVFGINISNFVMSIMTLAITIYVISTFTGKRDKK